MTNKDTLIIWKKFSKCIEEEISKNEAFAEKLGSLFEGLEPKLKSSEVKAPSVKKQSKKKRNKGKLDPFTVFESGEENLRKELMALEVDELKDIVVENRMDIGTVMRCRKAEKFVDHIIEMTRRRSTRGQSFLGI